MTIMSTKESSSKQDPATALYSPLHDWQTRILIVQPGNNNQPIESTLEVVTLIYGDGVILDRLKRKNEYCALSYCWGKPIRDAHILCNGLPLPVTSHLMNGLKRLRSQQDQTYLWVDAVCINQEDKAEVATQVALMVSVYVKATSVEVWLGESDGRAQPGALGLHHRDDMSPPRYLLGDLANNDWWNRVWVKQEVWAATDIRFHFSDRTATWDQLAAWCAIPAGGEGRDAVRSLMQSFVRPSLGIRKSVKDVDPPNPYFRDGEQDIVNVLRRVAGSKASDIRDHIYGLLGMSSVPVYTAGPDSAKPKIGITIDYHKSPADVFADVALYIMERDSGLNLLYLRGTFGGLIERDLIPSWVPDWRCATGPRVQSSIFLDSLILEELDTMTRNILPGSYSRPAIRYGNTLDIRGLVLGTVKSAQWNPEVTRIRSLDGVWIKCLSTSGLRREKLRITSENRSKVMDAINQALSEHTLRYYFKVIFTYQGKQWYACWEGPESVAYERWKPNSRHLTPGKPVANFLDDHASPIQPDYVGIVEIDPIHYQRTAYGSEFRLWLVEWSQSRPELGIYDEWLQCLRARAEDTIVHWIPPIWVVPRTSQPGDVLVHLRGGTFPVVLRAEKGGSYMYVGPADYLQAIWPYPRSKRQEHASLRSKELDIRGPPKATAQYFLLQAMIEYNEQRPEADWLRTFTLR